MSDKIKRVAVNLVRSKAFLDTMAALVEAELSRQLRDEFGGENIYFPKTSDNADKATRNELIRSLFTGNNHAELSKKTGLSPRHVRRICKK